MSRKYWTKEKIIAVIKEQYQENGVTTCTNIPQNILTAAVYKFGSWQNAVREAGLQPKEKTKKETNIIKWFDDKEATEIAKPKKYIESKCWECFAPIAGDEYFCPWHDHFQIPKGAVFYTDIKTSTGNPIQSVVITMCPLFKQETPEDRKRVRKRNIERAEKECLSKQGGYYKVIL